MPKPTPSEPTQSQSFEASFWRIIAATTQESGFRQLARLAEQLKPLSEEELLRFAKAFHELRARAYAPGLWGAAYLINGGCSEHCLAIFCDWLISRGQGIYERALQDPDSLAELEPLPEYVERESIFIAVALAYERRTGERFPRSYLMGDPLPDLERPWDFDDPEAMAEHYPRLWNVVGQRPRRLVLGAGDAEIFAPRAAKPPSGISSWRLGWSLEQVRDECERLGGRFEMPSPAGPDTWACGQPSQIGQLGAGGLCGSERAVCSLLADGRVAPGAPDRLVTHWREEYGATSKEDVQACEQGAGGRLDVRWEIDGFLWDVTFEERCSEFPIRFNAILLDQTRMKAELPEEGSTPGDAAPPDQAPPLQQQNP